MEYFAPTVYEEQEMPVAILSSETVLNSRLTGTSFFSPTAVGLVMVVVLAAVVVVVAVVTSVLAWPGWGALGV